jgi:hypothetical protein
MASLHQLPLDLLKLLFSNYVPLCSRYAARFTCKRSDVLLPLPC